MPVQYDPDSDPSTPAGSLKHVEFHQQSKLGTYDLGMCYVVMITSPAAAIVAHIATYLDPTNPHARISTSGKPVQVDDANVGRRINEVKARYGRMHQLGQFPTPTKTYLIDCHYGGFSKSSSHAGAIRKYEIVPSMIGVA